MNLHDNDKIMTVLDPDYSTNILIPPMLIIKSDKMSVWTSKSFKYL